MMIMAARMTAILVTLIMIMPGALNVAAAAFTLNEDPRSTLPLPSRVQVGGGKLCIRVGVDVDVDLPLSGLRMGEEEDSSTSSPQPLSSSSLCFNGIHGDNENNIDIDDIDAVEDYMAKAREWFESILLNREVQASLFQGHHNDRRPYIETVGSDNDEEQRRTRNRIRGKVSSAFTNDLPFESHQSSISFLYSAARQHSSFTSTSTIVKQERRILAEEEVREPLNASATLMNIFMALLCVCVAALAAGLTMGMVSIEPLQLLIKMRVGTPEEKKHAKALLPLVQQHHRLLVTLLLCNSISNEALPLFLDKLVPGYIAVLISVSLVLVFGEILPSAIFTGPNQIPIAAAMAPPVRGIMWMLAPVAYPIAKLLDKCLGHDDTHYVGDAYNRGELSALVRVIYEEQSRKKNELKSTMMLAANTLSSHAGVNNRNFATTSQRADNFLRAASGLGALDSHGHGTSGHPAGSNTNYLHLDEVAMVEGALSMKTKTAKDVYQPMDKVFSVPEETILDEDTMAHIYNSGHSRIPVYETSTSSSKLDDEGNFNDNDVEEPRKKIKSILLSRNLIVVDSDDQRPVCTLPLLQPHCVSPDKPLVDLINDFQALGPHISMAGHLAIVCEDPGMANDALNQNEAIPFEANVLGIVTLEDVIEELLQEEIVDESDKREYKTMQNARKSFARWKAIVQRNKNRRAGNGEVAVEEHVPVVDLVAAVEEAVEDAAVKAVLEENHIIDEANATLLHGHVNTSIEDTHLPSTNTSTADEPILDTSSDHVLVDVPSSAIESDNTPLLHHEPLTAPCGASANPFPGSSPTRRAKKDKKSRSYGAV